MAETKLEMADRHVRAGEKLCARQEELVHYMMRRGFDTAEAERLLSSLRQTLRLMQDHQREIRREAGYGA